MKAGMPHYLGEILAGNYIIKDSSAVGLFTLRGLFVICQQYLSTISALPVVMVYHGFDR